MGFIKGNSGTPTVPTGPGISPDYPALYSSDFIRVTTASSEKKCRYVKHNAEFNASSCLCTELAQIRTGTLLGANSITCAAHTLPIPPTRAAQGSRAGWSAHECRVRALGWVTTQRNLCPFFALFLTLSQLNYNFLRTHCKEHILLPTEKKKMKQQPHGKSRVRRSGYFSWLCFRLHD